MIGPRAAAAAAIAIALASCGARPRPAPGAAAAGPPRVAIVAAERGPRGARLVAIDETGDRQFELIEPIAAGVIRDASPAVSPDGRWIAFASTRGHAAGGTALWIAAVGVEVAPAPLGGGAWIDAHPVWTPDGRAIVFASTRDGGDYDLWRQPIADGRPRGAPTQLTRGAGHEVSPAIAPDGAIAYTAVTPVGPGPEVVSRIEERAPDGAIREITAGPGDAAPAISPDGATLVFSRPAQHAGALQAELWHMDRRAGAAAAAVLVALPITDESGPVWSRDGRFVLATSVLRGAAGQPLFSSVIHIEVAARPPRARILRDRAGALVRLTPAVAAPRLDAAALRESPEYQRALADIVAGAIAGARREPDAAP